MAKERYITIQEFMVRDLKLKGNELLVYAIIYGFSQDNENTYWKGNNYIAEWLGISNRNIVNVIQSLINKNLIEQIKEPNNNCRYKITSEKSSLVKKVHKGSEKSSQPPCEKSSLPTYKELNITNKYININININKRDLAEKFTTIQLKQFINSYLQNNELTETLMDFLRMRYKSKIKTTINAIYLMCKKINNMPIELRQEAIENSIMNGWQGIFEPSKNEIDKKYKEARIKEIELKTKKQETSQQRDDRNLKAMEKAMNKLMEEYNDNKGNYNIGETNQNTITDNINT